MPTDTVHSQTRARNFALRAVAWSVGLFGLLRLNWVELHALVPLAQVQGQIAQWLLGTPALPVVATLACSGADAMALCAGVILAYPVRWLRRISGAVIGLALVLGLNTLRIGTLGLVVASPAWFNALHLYIWPAVLILAVAAYVFVWMRLADGRTRDPQPTRASVTTAMTAATATASPGLTRRFIVLAAVCLLLYTAASPLYLDSAAVLAVAAFVARSAAAALRVVGVEAHVVGAQLLTSRGGFAVTQECISTPLIPIYLAAVAAYASTWRQRTMGLLAAAPLFVGLGIARLLVVALPAALVASPLFMIHAFFQLLLAAVIVSVAAYWRHGASRTAGRQVLLAVALGVTVAWLLGAPYARMLMGAAAWMAGIATGGAISQVTLGDPQDAIATLPAFQTGLYAALWVAAFTAIGWRRFATGLAVITVLQVATLMTIYTLALRCDVTVHVRDVRAWALVAPLLVVIVASRARGVTNRHAPTGSASEAGASTAPSAR